MNHRSTRPFLCAFALVMASVIPSAAFAADTFKIDAVHSETSFRIRHLVSKTGGRFTKFAGDIQVDSANPSKSSVKVEIQAASITTDNEGRDKHLRGADFFDVEKFPTLTFTSSAVKAISGDKPSVTKA